MSTDVPLTGATGSGYPITFRSNEYILHTMNDRYRSQFSRWFQRKAIADTLALRDAYPAERFKEVLASVQRDINAGVYSIGTPAYQSILNTPEGTVALYRILFDDERVSDRIVEAMFEDDAEGLIAAFNSLHPETSCPKVTSPENSTPT